MKKRLISAAVVVWCLAIVIVGCQKISKSKANETVINEKSSKELLEEVLESSSIVDLYLYNEPNTVIEIMKSESNSFAKLEERKDYIETVIDKYNEYELANDFSTDKHILDSLTYVYGEELDNKLNEVLADLDVKESVESDVTELARVYFLECLITSKGVVEESNSQQLSDIKKVAYDKYMEKENSALYTGMEESVYELADKSETAKDLGVEINSRGQLATITTPNGSKVEVEMCEYNGDRWANAVTMETKKDYPNVKILAKADNRYNCHSYAWYQQSTSNPYWLNNPMSFIADGSFKETTRIVKNDKIIWAVKTGRPYIEHSGVVKGQDKNGVVVVSKWGQGPLVQHLDSYSPYVNKTYIYMRNN